MKHYLEKLTTDISGAAAISPVIRALSEDCGDLSVVVFDGSLRDLSRDNLISKIEQTGLEYAITDFEEEIEGIYSWIKSEYKRTENIKVFAVVGMGLFVTGNSKADADLALKCVLEGFTYEIDAMYCCVPVGRLSGKIAIVTGSAQGFGEGIAQELVSEGAYVVIADLNLELAQTVADKMNEDYGAGTAIAVKVNVADETSVKEMVERVVCEYGGLDVFVSNAGVLRAGGLEDLSVSDFDFVTRINYLAYFICVKFASRPMKIQSYINPEYWTDIIQINSKSGLEGSNKNFAYAGGKFGGIGLTQSFALELVTDNIKVNSICPGNFYEGPLWSDPERGLFVQYLKAGKVPGAKTIDDVKDFYLSKSPIRRGCSPLDVSRAIFYCIEQKYETGQAIPVTGGQKMLK